MILTHEVTAVLDAATVEGHKLFLSPARLDRDLYQAVSKVLEALGGKWTGRLGKGGHHLFDGDPSEAIEQAVATGVAANRKQELGFFETPAPLARRLVELADVRPGHFVLEPSAGRGAIVRAINEAEPRAGVAVIDIDPKHEPHWGPLSISSQFVGDFLTEKLNGIYDRIIANPPFGKAQRDIDHVLHMWDCLKPGGRLVSVMADGVMWRNNANSVAFRERIEANGGTIEKLPPGSFSQSGTDVNTCVVCVDKPGGAA